MISVFVHLFVHPSVLLSIPPKPPNSRGIDEQADERTKPSYVAGEIGH